MELCRRIIGLALALCALACTSGLEPEPEQSAEPQGGVLPPLGKSDAWDWVNDPKRFARFVDEELELRLDALPLKGTASRKAWPASYWPTYEDSTNHRWQGSDTMSPLEKYDLVFNGWQPPEGFMELRPRDLVGCDEGFDASYYEALGPAADWMSRERGNLRARDGVDSDGDGEVDECGDSDGIDGWWGSCHAWAPAAMLEDEPRRPVRRGDVTFEIADIKALLITVYDKSRSVVIGSRCRAKVVERDETGRILDPNCRDTNAGSFHVVMANLMGMHGLGIGEDRTFGAQVWNQPIHGYEVTAMKEISEAEATKRLLGPGSDEAAYPYNADARRWVEVAMDVFWVTESVPTDQPLLDVHDEYVRTDSYAYVLELDDEGRIIGGEWIEAGADRSIGFSPHPDFLWVPMGPLANPGPTAHGPRDPWKNPHVNINRVRELLAESVAGGD